jgi:hypothetical protein
LADNPEYRHYNNNIMNPLDRAAMGFSGSQYCAPSETVTPNNTTKFAYVVAIGGDTDVSAHTGANCENLPATFTIPEGVDFPILFSSISVDAASTGGLIAVEFTPNN